MVKKYFKDIMNNSEAETNFTFDYMMLPQYAICLFGVISHILLLVAFLKDPFKFFRNSGTYLVINLAISDFFVCFFGPATTSVTITLTINRTTLKANILTTSFFCVSVATIFLISLDRYIMVNHPIKRRMLLDEKIVGAWIALAWLSGSVFLLCGMLFGITEQADFIKDCMLSSTIMFAVVLYVGTYLTLKKQSKNISLQNSTNTIASRNQEMRILKEKRFLATIMFIASIAFVSLVLSVIFYRVVLFLTKQRQIKTARSYQALVGIVSVVYYFNFAINPLIYFIRLPNYRKTFSYLYLRKRT